MMPATTNGSGKCFAFPDVCKTPSPGGPVPIPYPNIANCSQAKGGTLSSKVKIMGKKTATIKTEISMSSGDEAGSAGGGVVSSKIKGPAKYKKGSSKVKAEGAMVAHLLSITAQNGVANANIPPGSNIKKTQNKVTVAV